MEIIYGRQPVLELLRAGRRSINRILIFQRVRPSDSVKRIRKLAAGEGVRLEQVDHPVLDRLVGGGNHQGVVAEVGEYPYADDFAIEENSVARPPFWLLLDQIQDPQNLGAILRSADAAGVDAVILPRVRSARITPAVVRVSAGASEHLNIYRVESLPQKMDILKDRGFRLIGLEMRSQAKLYTEVDTEGPVGLVVGSEGEGISRVVRNRCDSFIGIPMQGQINSLNASAAAAVALFEIWRHRSSTAPVSESGDI